MSDILYECVLLPTEVCLLDEMNVSDSLHKCVLLPTELCQLAEMNVSIS